MKSKICRSQKTRSKSYRLDRFISQHSEHKLSAVRLLIAQRRILLDGDFADSAHQTVGPFTRVELDGSVLQDLQAVYLMLNKPQGVVSATQDLHHRTVIDVIEHPQKQTLHIVGRLDFNTTGLLLLTNDGAWSRKVSLPETKLVKTYHVTLANPVTEEMVKTFAQGIYFAYEGITTKPATLKPLTEYTAIIELVEGKYHQIKRMFGYFQNEVTALHRTAVGHIELEDLKLGQSRPLTNDEIMKSVERHN